jgi:hypothetical protein
MCVPVFNVFVELVRERDRLFNNKTTNVHIYFQNIFLFIHCFRFSEAATVKQNKDLYSSAYTNSFLTA